MSDVLSFSEKMRSRAEEVWKAALNHRFFCEVATDSIDDRVFARYLRIEYGFVDTAAVALGYAVAKAPSFKERRRLALGLYGLVTDQKGFLVDAFERMAVPAEARTGLAPQGFRSPCITSSSPSPRRRATRKFRLHPRGGVAVSDLVLEGRPVSIHSRLHPGLGLAARRRSLRGACRVGSL